MEPMSVCRYTKDLPAGVTRMNDECLKLKDHTAGYQTVEDIQRVVTEAIGGRTALMNERLIDEVMVSRPSVVTLVIRWTLTHQLDLLNLKAS
jgi:hypothetical protein